MKKFIATSLLTLIFSVSVWSQIPDPAYIPSEYQDTIVIEDNSAIDSKNGTQVTINKVEKIKLQPKLHIGFGNFNFKGDILIIEIQELSDSLDFKLDYLPTLVNM